jgi:hypothetical protein
MIKKRIRQYSFNSTVIIRVGILFFALTIQNICNHIGEIQNADVPYVGICALEPTAELTRKNDGQTDEMNSFNNTNEIVSEEWYEKLLEEMQKEFLRRILR